MKDNVSKIRMDCNRKLKAPTVALYEYDMEERESYFVIGTAIHRVRERAYVIKRMFVSDIGLNHIIPEPIGCCDELAVTEFDKCLFS